MGNTREPINLIIAKGKKHLTQGEIRQRREQEIEVPFTDVKPPDYFNESQKREFMDIAEKLLAINIFTELDVDCLSRYILAKGLYLKYTSALTSLIKSRKISDIAKMQALQDKAFKQCQSCARDLGLTITSRCKLSIPQVEDDEDLEL